MSYGPLRTRARLSFHGSLLEVDGFLRMVRLERHRETSGLPEARSNSVADPGQLEVVRRLGEGSFAVVDLCEFSGDGLLSLPSSRASDLQSANKSVLVAVKKMKTHVDPPPPNPYANANHAPPLEPVPQVRARAMHCSLSLKFFICAARTLPLTRPVACFRAARNGWRTSRQRPPCCAP